MNLYKNLNDIPFQFRQYEHRNNQGQKDSQKENIPSEFTELKINSQSTSKEIPKNTSEKKINEITNQSLNCQMDIKDKIFIFLILLIFFDAL